MADVDNRNEFTDEVPDETVRGFERLLTAAMIACGELPSTYEFEPAFVRLLDYLLEHPELKPYAVQRFLFVLTPAGGGGGELVPFCMHTLRWEEVRAVVKEWADVAYAKNDWRALPVFIDVLASYDDEWKDGSLFLYYEQESDEKPG